MRCAQINIFGMGIGLIVNGLGLARIWSESKDKDYQINNEDRRADLQHFSTFNILWSWVEEVY